MKYYEFDIDPKFVTDAGLKWTVTGNGEYVIGTSGGLAYFIKRNIHYRWPKKTDSPALKAVKQPDCDFITAKQRQIKAKMAGLKWNADHIVVEEKNFWDMDNKFTTVTVSVPGIVSNETDFTGLSLADFLTLAKDLAKRIEILHDHGVIHGDLKKKNVLFKPQGSSYETYIVDFDISYTADAITAREKIGGSEGYMSPELLDYRIAEDDDRDPIPDVDASVITYATDIFSLGVIFHELWFGMPTTDADGTSAGDALNAGKTVTVDDKFNVQIGAAKGATLKSLINWMLQKDFKVRPTAKQVVEVLSDALEVPSAYHVGADAKPYDDELWTAHKLIAAPLTSDELSAKGVTSFKRINDGTGSGGFKYKVGTASGESVLTIEELMKAGYAKGLVTSFADPWPDDKIEFAPVDEIMAKGYTNIEPVMLAGRRTYRITMSGGMTFTKNASWLISEGLAAPKKYTPIADTPWPEHGTMYVPENMELLKITDIKRVEIGGEHRYSYTKTVGGASQLVEGVSANNLRIMGLIK